MATRLSDNLRSLIPSDGKNTTLQELLEKAGQEGVLLLIIVLNIPFTLPIPIPHLSTPFGIALLFLSAKLTWGIPQKLPVFIGDRAISPSILKTILEKCLSIVVKIEKKIGNQQQFLCDSRLFYPFNLFIFFLMSIILALPLTFPFTNCLPAITMILIAMGLIEKDGRLVCLGYFTMAVSFGYLYLLYLFGIEIILWAQKLPWVSGIVQWFQNLF